jgi:hypothetical protein
VKGFLRLFVSDWTEKSPALIFLRGCFEKNDLWILGTAQSFEVKKSKFENPMAAA